MNEEEKTDKQKDEEEAKAKAEAAAAETARIEETKIPAIDEAKKAAKALRDATAEQKLENDRTEKLTAEAELSGQAKMSPTPKEISPEEKAKRDRIKAVGLASGAQWAKNMEKEDDGK